MIPFLNFISPDSKPVKRGAQKGDPGSNPFFRSGFAIFLFLVAGFAIYMSLPDFLVDKDGEPELAPWRKEKLLKELDDLDNAEQYVLKAGVPGKYPCYNCTGSDEIFLHLNEVWRYGVTTKSQSGRYPEGLPHPGLVYVIQFQGPLQACMAEEKTKIYKYALLPENLARKVPLIRPPGNKVDR